MAGKPPDRFFARARGAEHGQAALAQQVAVAAHVEVGRHRPVGDDQVQPVDSQVGQQRRQAPLAADQPHRLVEPERRIHQPVGHRLRHRIGDADPERQRFPGLLAAQDLLQLVGDGEDFLRVADDAASGIRGFEVAADAAEQFHAQARLEFAQLAADRMRRQVQLLRRARDAAGLGHHPEVPQMLEVECRHSVVPPGQRNCNSRMSAGKA
jgi:hypothetical protein